MAIRIGSNSAALSVTRRIDDATQGVSRVLERLSSGSRINRASDDAAGLSIATVLGSRTRVLNRARSNISDASSLIQIADGALGEVTNLLTRMTELAQQAANGSYSLTQRKSLDTEYQQLDREIRRITASTSFNGLSLLSGGRSARSRENLLTGAGGLNARAISSNGRYAFYTDVTDSDDPILYRKDFETGQVSQIQLSASTLFNGNFQVLDNGDVFFAAVQGSGNDVFRWSVGSNQAERLTQSQDLFDTTAFRVSADGSTMYLTVVNTDYADGGTKESAYETSTTPNLYRIDLATGIFTRGPDEFVSTGTSPFVSADGQFLAIATSATSFRVGRITASGVDYRDLSGVTGLSLTGVDSEGNAVFTSTANLNGDNPNSYRQIFRFNSLTGTLSQLSNFNLNATLSAVTMSNDGSSIFFRTSSDLAGVGTGGVTQVFRLDSTLGSLTQMTRFASNQFSSTSSLLSSSGNRFLLGDAVGSTFIDSLDVSASDSSFDIEAGFGSTGNLLVKFKGMESALRGLRSHSLRSASGALMALEDMRYNIQALSQARGVLGAAESRLLSALALTESQSEQFSAAESRLRDVDIASESARLVTLQITQQAATSVLAQVNQAPALALQLLR